MSDSGFTRRQFLGSALASGTLLALGAVGAVPSLLAAVPVPARKLRLGLLLPGGSSADGNAVASGVRFAVEEIQRMVGSAGGGFELLEATAADPQAAAREATRLASKEKVSALIGGLDPRTRETVAEVAERLHVLFLTTRAPGDVPPQAPVRPHLFHLNTPHYDLCRALSRYLAGEAHLPSWFFVGTAGEAGAFLTASARQTHLQNGGSLAGAATVEPGATSFAPLLEQLAKARPQVVFLNLGEPTVSRLVAALDHAGPALAATVVTGPFPPLEGDRLEAPGARRAIWPALWHPAVAAGGAAALNQRFQARYNRPMGSLAWMGWAAIQALAEVTLKPVSPAAASALPPGADLATRLAFYAFDGHKVTPLRFDFNHYLRQPIYLVGAKPGAPPGPLALLGKVEPEQGG